MAERMPDPKKPSPMTVAASKLRALVADLDDGTFLGGEGELRHQQQPALDLAQREIHAPLAVGKDAVGKQPLEEPLGLILRVLAPHRDEGEEASGD